MQFNADGSFTYTADSDRRVGTLSSFTYHNNDGVQDSNIATATLVRQLAVSLGILCAEWQHL